MVGDIAYALVAFGPFRLIGSCSRMSYRCCMAAFSQPAPLPVPRFWRYLVDGS